MANGNAFTRKLALRAPLTEDDVGALSRATEDTRRVGPGHALVSEGDPPEHVHIVLEGFACRHRRVPDGGRAIVAYLVPGDGCDLHASVLERMVHGIATLTPCVIASISYRTVKDLAAHRPNVYLALWRSILIDELMLQEWLVGVGRRPVEKQIAHFLCEVITRLQVVGFALEEGYRLPLTQSELADTAGLSHVHVNRVLGDLRKAGLIGSGRKSLVVPNLEALKEFASFDPGYLHLTGSRTSSEPPLELADAKRLEFERLFG